ncbi:MAG: dihydroneopterin aldolase [Acidimicrobiales bacterium]
MVEPIEPEKARVLLRPDSVILTGIRALGRHGVLHEERERAQPFEIDLEVQLDLRPAGASDELTDTVDYARMAKAAATVVAEGNHLLLERLAEGIADAVRADERVQSVTVCVRKLRPPVDCHLEHAAVRITRP